MVLQSTPSAFSLLHYDATGKMVGTYPLAEGTAVLGRSGGKSDPDVVLTDRDMTVSRFHMSVTRRGSEILAEDFNSRNGTFLKVADAVEVGHGDVIRLGRQILRLNLRAEAPTKVGSMPTVQTPAVSSEETPAPTPSPVAVQTAQVTFAGLDVMLPIKPSETILDVADEHDVEMDYECWIGKCGCDLIRIVDGHEFLSELSEQESKTISRKGGEPGECRLACMTKVSGPVVVEVVQ